MFLVGGTIHCLQSHLIAHTFCNRDTICIDAGAVKSAKAAAGHRLHLLKIGNDGYIRQVRLLFDRSEESIPIQILILGSLVAEQYIGLSKS